MKRADLITEITPGSAKAWHAGVFAIEHEPSGRRLYVATRSIGKRVWDALHRLRLGCHKNSELQHDWLARPDAFRVVLVDRVTVVGLLGLVKQSRIDMDRASGTCPPYNKKNAIPRRRRPTPFRLDLSLPTNFSFEPSPELRERVYERVLRIATHTAHSGGNLSPTQMRARAEQAMEHVRMTLNRRGDAATW